MRIFAGMNNFDYTSVPDDLLYSDRRHLDDFGVEDTKSLNYLIEKGIYKLYYTYPHYEKFAKDVFNTAYKICTLALVDSHPKRKFGTYLSIIAEQMHHREDEIGIVLSVILIQIDAHKWKETKSEMSDLGLCIFYEIEQNKDIYYNYFKQVVHNYDKRCANTTVPPDSEFKPREITMGVLRHTCSHWDWNGHFGTDMDKMLDFIFAIGKNEDEQKIISSFLQEETHSSFSKGAEHKYCFEYIDRQIYLRYHAEEENAQIEAEIEKDLMKEYEQQWELDYYKDEFQKLKAENESLHSEIEQLKKKIDDEDQTNTSQNQSADENILQQLADAQKTIKEQAQNIKELKDVIDSRDVWYKGEYEKLPDDILFTLRERVVFFSTVLSIELNKKYTVLANLAKLIDELCNDQNNIAPFISRMQKPEEASANAKAAKKVASIMRSIIPKEYQQDKHLKINQYIESMLQNYPESEDE